MFRLCARDVASLGIACRSVPHRAAAKFEGGAWGLVGLQYAFNSSVADQQDFRALVSSLRAESLASSREADRPAAGAESSLWSRMILSVAGFYSRESQLLRAAKCLHESVLEQGTDPRLQQALNIGETFAQRYSLMCIHVWLLLVRLRAEGDDGKELAQMLYENFQESVEDMVRKEGVVVRLSKQLKELERIFYGSCLAYERGVAGQENLQAAILRNVFGGKEQHQADAKALAHYMRREAACLSLTDSDALMKGQVKFSHQFWAGGAPQQNANVPS